jgi:hypothetical protein
VKGRCEAASEDAPFFHGGDTGSVPPGMPRSSGFRFNEEEWTKKHQRPLSVQ